MRESSKQSVGLVFPWRAKLSMIIVLVVLLSVSLASTAQVPTAVTGTADWHDVCFDPTLSGTVNGFGVETVVEFEWEDTANEPGDIHRELAQQSPITDSGEIEVSLDIVIEAPCTLRFRVIATNANGTTYGEWTEEGTNQPICIIDDPDEDPSLLDAETLAADYHDYCKDPTLYGRVNGHGLLTTVQFEWEELNGIGSGIELADQNPITLPYPEDVEVSLSITTSTNASIRYRVIATSDVGTAFGEWVEAGPEISCKIDIFAPITAHTFNDLNGNGTQEAGEPDLSGWEFTLYAGPTCGGAPLGTATTDTNGNAEFWYLSAGDYAVGETSQTAWFPTTPSCQTVTLSSPLDMTVLNFGNCQQGSDESQSLSCLQIVSIVCIEGHTQIMVENCGPEVCSGDAQVRLGLSYDRSWIPEWHTLFFWSEPEGMELEPGEYAIITIDVPTIPTWALAVLRERLIGCWTGYEDTDIENDYLGVIFLIGDAAAYGFLPLDWYCSTTEEQ